MQEIAVITNFSRALKGVLNLAVGIANNADTRIKLVYYHENGATDEDREMHNEHIQTILKASDLIDMKYVEAIDLDAKKNIEHELKEGKLAQSDIILIGAPNQEHQSFADSFRESDINKFIDHSFKPVIIAPESMDDSIHTIEEAVFVSYYDKDGLMSYYRFLPLIKALDIKLHLLYINTSGIFHETSKRCRKSLRDFIIKTDITNYEQHVIEAKTMEEGINGYCNENDIDMICLTTRFETNLKHIFLAGNVVDDLLNHNNLPIMTINDANLDLDIINEKIEKAPEDADLKYDPGTSSI